MSTIIKEIAQLKPVRDFYDHFYISLKNRYAFHTVGKAANSTVKHLLYQLDLQNVPVKMPSVHDRASSPLLSPYQLSGKDHDWVFTSDDFFKFTFVRNPYSRLLSCYLDRILCLNSRPYFELLRILGKEKGYKPSFDEFINAICSQTTFQQNNHWRVQYDDTLMSKVNYDFIGKQENFASDFSYVYKRITGMDIKIELLKTNASPTKTSSEKRLSTYWNKSLVQKVQLKYENDFNHFDYPSELDINE